MSYLNAERTRYREQDRCATSTQIQDKTIQNRVYWLPMALHPWQSPVLNGTDRLREFY
ncbi:MAG: hypothetical protein R2814_02770 [Flavobacteriaceae bacterium]